MNDSKSGNSGCLGLVVLVTAIIFIVGICNKEEEKEKKKRTIDDIVFMTNGCYVKNERKKYGNREYEHQIYKFEIINITYFNLEKNKRVNEDIIQMRHIYQKNNKRKLGYDMSTSLVIDKSGDTLVSINTTDSYLKIPIPKNENDPIYVIVLDDSCKKTYTGCYVY